MFGLNLILCFSNEHRGIRQVYYVEFIAVESFFFLPLNSGLRKERIHVDILFDLLYFRKKFTVTLFIVTILIKRLAV